MHCVKEVHAEQLVGQVKQEPLDRYLPVTHKVHCVKEVQEEQLVGQVKQKPLDRYLPVAHEEQD